MRDPPGRNAAESFAHYRPPASQGFLCNQPLEVPLGTYGSSSYLQHSGPVKVEGGIPVIEMPDERRRTVRVGAGHRLQRFSDTCRGANQHGRPEVAVDDRDWPEHQAIRRANGPPD